MIGVAHAPTVFETVTGRLVLWIVPRTLLPVLNVNVPVRDVTVCAAHGHVQPARAGQMHDEPYLPIAVPL